MFTLNIGCGKNASACSCSGFRMTLRRGFIRSLRDHGEAPAPAPASGSTGTGDLRSYLASLRGEEPAASNSPPSHAMISFSLASLNEFRFNAPVMTSFKKQTPPPSKRPGYNNSKRRFYMNPTERVRLLEFETTLFCSSEFSAR